MTRDEYLAMLESDPVTPGQRGAIMRECDRLGLTDRAERLAILAELLDLDALGSTGELTMGQAGKLVNVLQNTRDRADLPEIAEAGDVGGQDHGDAGGGDGDGEFISVAEAIGQIMLMIAVAVHGRDAAGESGNVARHIARLYATDGFHAQGRPNRPFIILNAPRVPGA